MQWLAYFIDTFMIAIIADSAASIRYLGQSSLPIPGGEWTPDVLVLKRADHPISCATRWHQW
jgi:hypothetical protein